MSHRNSQPKPSARERTLRRWRERHDYSTPEDEKHRSKVQEVKDSVLNWLMKKKAIKVERAVGGLERTI